MPFHQDQVLVPSENMQVLRSLQPFRIDRGELAWPDGQISATAGLVLKLTELLPHMGIDINGLDSLVNILEHDDDRYLPSSTDLYEKIRLLVSQSEALSVIARPLEQQIAAS